ncbi:CtrA inhibitor SciP [Glacieibacterium frigidum]|uniref:DUF1153 domain-containing protein n=1 Tax=Glacieibacterium frigidum TaxID=2593303 RepID=A0A552U7A8_9SPHN|nr:DUF1153 domain-containing protein [Glacieibacterium frigidum]TRW14103.1 DUF1153 domain-containing protein [Glacieibacterium frigidum]
MPGDAIAPRPASVPGPLGRPLTRADLPPPDTRRWVARRKAEVIAAIHGGLLGRDEARKLYNLSEEELRLWERAISCAGLPGLRVTRVQIYRPVFESVP